MRQLGLTFSNISKCFIIVSGNTHHWAISAPLNLTRRYEATPRSGGLKPRFDRPSSVCHPPTARHIGIIIGQHGRFLRHCRERTVQFACGRCNFRLRE